MTSLHTKFYAFSPSTHLSPSDRAKDTFAPSPICLLKKTVNSTQIACFSRICYFTSFWKPNTSAVIVTYTSEIHASSLLFLIVRNECVYGLGTRRWQNLRTKFGGDWFSNSQLEVDTLLHTKKCMHVAVFVFHARELGELKA
jgi:hypothetical protein